MQFGDLIFFLLTVVMGITDFIPTFLYWIQSMASKGVAEVRS